MSATRPDHPATLTFLLPMPPQRANFRGSWQKAHGLKLRYWHQLDNLALQKLIPRAPLKPWWPALIHARFYMRGVFMDQDNALARCKWPVDWLVSRGYLVGDTPAHLRWAGVPEQCKMRGVVSAPSVELVLTPAEVLPPPARAYPDRGL